MFYLRKYVLYLSTSIIHPHKYKYCKSRISTTLIESHLLCPLTSNYYISLIFIIKAYRVLLLPIIKISNENFLVRDSLCSLN